MALDDMVSLLCSKLELKFLDAAMLISIAADLKINQIVNSYVGARAAMPLTVFPHGSFMLDYPLRFSNSQERKGGDILRCK